MPSPVTIMDWQSRLSSGNTGATTRGVGQDELVEKRLNDLTASNSRYVQQARGGAMRAASGRGMMTSSMAAGNAEVGAIQAALPIASQDATTYGRTASENMAAQNADSLADQQIHGQLVGQEMGIQANLDEADVNRGWQTGEREATQGWQSGENLANRNWQTGERQDTQGWQTGEREATQGWQTGERLGQQGWQSGENATQRGWQSGERVAGEQFQRGERIDTQGWQTGERIGQQGWQTGERLGQQGFQQGEREASQTWQGAENQMGRALQTSERLGQELFQSGQQELARSHDLNVQSINQSFDAAQRDLDRNANLTAQEKQYAQQRFSEFNASMLNYNNNLTNTLTAIYSNPSMTAEQQRAAADNARAASKSLFDTYAATMASGVPPIFWEPYQLGGGQPAPGSASAPVIPAAGVPVTANPTPTVPVSTVPNYGGAQYDNFGNPVSGGRSYGRDPELYP